VIRQRPTTRGGSALLALLTLHLPQESILTQSAFANAVLLLIRVSAEFEVWYVWGAVDTPLQTTLPSGTESAAARGAKAKRAYWLAGNAKTPTPLGSGFSVNQSDFLSSLLIFWLPVRTTSHNDSLFLKWG